MWYDACKSRTYDSLVIKLEIVLQEIIRSGPRILVRYYSTG